MNYEITSIEYDLKNREVNFKLHWHEKKRNQPKEISLSLDETLIQLINNKINSN